MVQQEGTQGSRVGDLLLPGGDITVEDTIGTLDLEQIEHLVGTLQMPDREVVEQEVGTLDLVAPSQLPEMEVGNVLLPLPQEALVGTVQLAPAPREKFVGDLALPFSPVEQRVGVVGLRQAMVNNPTNLRVHVSPIGYEAYTPFYRNGATTDVIGGGNITVNWDPPVNSDSRNIAYRVTIRTVSYTHLTLPTICSV